MESDSSLEIASPRPSISSASKEKKPSASSAPSPSHNGAASRFTKSASASVEPVSTAAPPRPKARRLGRPTGASTGSATSIPSTSTTKSTSNESQRSNGSTSRVPIKAKVKAEVVMINSDDDDDFFVKKTVSTKLQKAGIKAGAKWKPATEFDVSNTVTISSSSSENGKSGPESEAEEDSAQYKGKTLNLPLWAKVATGADKRFANCTGKNRRKKRRGESSSDEESEKKRGKKKAASGSDDDDDESDGSCSSDTEKKKGMRNKRGRGRSLTPPVPMNDSAVQAALLEMRERMAIQPEISTAPTELEVSSPSSGTEAFDPSLQAIIDSKSSKPKAATLDLDSDVIEIVETKKVRVVDADEEVTIRVSMVWDPAREVKSEKVKEVFQRPRDFTMKRNEPFRGLLEQISASKGIPASDLLLTYKSGKIYPFGKPSLLEITHSADFKCYTLDVFTRVQDEKKRRLEGRSLNDEDDDDGSMGGPPSRGVTMSATPMGRESLQPGHQQNTDDGDATPKQGMNIYVRGSANQILPLTVKPTTTIASILKAFGKKFGIEKEKLEKCWLEFDGEKLDKHLAIKMFDDIEGDEETLDVREAK